MNLLHSLKKLCIVLCCIAFTIGMTSLHRIYALPLAFDPIHPEVMLYSFFHSLSHQDSVDIIPKKASFKDLINPENSKTSDDQKTFNVYGSNEFYIDSTFLLLSDEERTKNLEILCGDTITLTVTLEPNLLKVSRVLWSLNGDSIARHHDLRFSCAAPLYSEDVRDTLSIELRDDRTSTSLTCSWFIGYLPIVAFNPVGDTAIVAGDTLNLSVYFMDHPLNCQWFINGEPKLNDNGPLFHYIAEKIKKSADTIQVWLIDADSTVVQRHTWLAYINSPAETVPSFYSFSPASDTTLRDADAVRFTIRTNADSLRIRWFVNNVLFEDSTDFNFTYFTTATSPEVDTISAIIEDLKADSGFSHDWYVSIEPSDAIEYRFTCSPEGDTMLVSGDSLTFEVRCESDSVFYQWFLNDRFLQSIDVCAYRYLADSTQRRLDSIRCVVFDQKGDTLFRNTWRIDIKPIASVFSLMNPDTTFERSGEFSDNLTPPELVSPAGDHVLTETDYLEWSIDSSLVNDVTSILRIAVDSSFTSCICVDSCQPGNSLKIGAMEDFHNLVVGSEYFWEVKLVDDAGDESPYRKCRKPFLFISTFVSLNGFSGKESGPGTITLYWQAENEYNHLGFNLYRKEVESGNFIKINDNLIRGERNYIFEDQQMIPGRDYLYRLEDVTVDGKTKILETLSLMTRLPEGYALFPNYPNPFNNYTVFKYQIPVKSPVVIEIYNVLGRKIRTLVDETKDPGYYAADWDGLDGEGAPGVSGIYFYHMTTQSYHETRKMTLVR